MHTSEQKSQRNITKRYHRRKPLPFGTFVLERNIPNIHFSDNLNLFEWVLQYTRCNL